MVFEREQGKGKGKRGKEKNRIGNQKERREMAL
jgi:hypothetical protein